jgi:hypothetical protein
MTETIERILAVDEHRTLRVQADVVRRSIQPQTIRLVVHEGFFPRLFEVQPNDRTRQALLYFLQTGDLDTTLRKEGYL